MTEVELMVSKVAQLRDEFDQLYARPPVIDSKDQVENLIGIRVSGDPYAIRVSEIAGLVNNRKTIPAPSPITEFMGIAGVRGGLVPVYSLSPLLGHSNDAEPGRWLAICGLEQPVALAFSDFEGYLRLPRSQVYPARQAQTASPLITHVLREANIVRAVISIPPLIESIRRRCAEYQVSKEQ